MKARLATILVFLSLCIPAARAWGPEGHRVVGEIAQGLLTEAAAREVALLLRDDRLHDRAPSARRTLGEVANWADEIREQPWSRKYASWHYENFPLCEKLPRAKVCPRGNCASERLAQQLEVLADRRKPRRDRNEALKWVVHLAADIHQPLHAADNRDRGGNAVAVEFFGRTEGRRGALSLHTVWDEQLVERLLAARGGESALGAMPIAPLDHAAWQRGSIADWMAESRTLALEVAYGGIPRFRCGEPIAVPVTIGQAYFDAAGPAIERQLRRAGVRLAKLLNESLAGEGAGR